MDRIFFDAENRAAGRLASRAAREALKGKAVIVVNAEKAIITGNPTFVIKRYYGMVDRGSPYHGPFYPRLPDRMLRRIIRGMLPYSRQRGKQAFRRVMVYNSVPEEFSKQDFIKGGDISAPKYITLGTLAERLGAKRTW